MEWGLKRIRKIPNSKDEQDVEETCTFAYSFINSSLIKVRFRNDYVELKFKKNSGVVNPESYPNMKDTTHELHLNIYKNNWSIYMQENDYSFDPWKTEFKNWNHVTLYDNGTLVYGQEPIEFSGISCDLSFPINCGYEDHWLPNTGESLALSYINIKGTDAAGNDVILQPPLNNIMILPPVDPGWQTNDPGNSNIHRNKGTCAYDLYVVYSNGDEEVLATFYKDNQEDPQYFQVEFTDGYFFDQPEMNPILYGMAKHQSGYFLQTRQSRPNPGTVYFCNTNRPAGQRETEDFRLRIIQEGTTMIRPGDDIQLRFGVSGYPGYNTAVPEGDFMAVYDKKLLWRVNLYIDDGFDDN